MVPGPLFDFGLHMFHNSKLLMKEGNGPFFYLPKVWVSFYQALIGNLKLLHHAYKNHTQAN